MNAALLKTPIRSAITSGLLCNWCASFKSGACISCSRRIFNYLGCKKRVIVWCQIWVREPRKVITAQSEYNSGFHQI